MDPLFDDLAELLFDFLSGVRTGSETGTFSCFLTRTGDTFD